MRFWPSSLFWNSLPQAAAIFQGGQYTHEILLISNMLIGVVYAVANPGLDKRQPLATTSACEAYCRFATDATVYAWASGSRQLGAGVHSSTLSLTSTIVTVINTVVNTTTKSTKFPSEYHSAVPTNHDGTQVQTISFTRQGRRVVTTV